MLRKVKILFIISCIIFVSNSFAEYIMLHGHSGQVEHLDRVSKVVNRGPGSDVYQKRGQNNWIHYAFQDKYYSKYDEIILYVKTYSPDVYITAVSVWDGPKKVQAFNDLNIYAPEYSYIPFTLECMPFKKGMAVSVEIRAEDGASEEYNRIVISAVYAHRCSTESPSFSNKSPLLGQDEYQDDPDE